MELIIAPALFTASLVIMMFANRKTTWFMLAVVFGITTYGMYV